MGLTVYFYETATLLPEHQRRDECRDGGHVRAYTIDGLEHGLGKLLIPGRCYQTSGAELKISNSYHGYNAYREALSVAVFGVEPEVVWADLDSYRDRPFFAQVHFADNEGVFGPDIAAQLAEDYRTFRANITHDLDAIDTATYDRWTAGLTLAADTGIVDFC